MTGEVRRKGPIFKDGDGLNLEGTLAFLTQLKAKGSH